MADTTTPPVTPTADDCYNVLKEMVLLLQRTADAVERIQIALLGED